MISGSTFDRPASLDRARSPLDAPEAQGDEPVDQASKKELTVPVAQDSSDTDGDRARKSDAPTRVTTRAFDKLLDHWRDCYAVLGHYGAAKEMGTTQWRDDVEVRDGVVDLRPLSPFARRVEDRWYGSHWGTVPEIDRPPVPLRDKERPAGPHYGAIRKPDVATAREAWEEAARSGDADAMTRTANALIQAVAAARSSRTDDATESEVGSTEDSSDRDPIRELLAGGDELESRHDLPRDGSAIEANSDVDGSGQPNDVQPRANADVPPGEAAGGDPAAASSDRDVPPGWTATDQGPVRERGDAVPPLSDAHSETVAKVIAGLPRGQALDALARLRDRLGSEMTMQTIAKLARLGSGSESSVAASEVNRRPSRAPEEASTLSREASAGEFRPVAQRSPSMKPIHTDPRTAGLLRLNRVREKWVGRPPGSADGTFDLRDRFPSLVRPGDDWADPSHGWEEADVLDILEQQAKSRDLTPEILQLLSDEIYQRPPEELLRLLDQRGWQPIASRTTENGYQAIALLHRGSNTVVIVNRGTEFSKLIASESPEARDDIGADYNIFFGEPSDQLWDARDFLQEVVGKVGKNAQYVVTGHSLGGALAQMQVAAGYLDPDLSGLDVAGITFAALGAVPSIEATYRDHFGAKLDGLRAFGRDRLVNYRRTGDGFVARAKMKPFEGYRPEVLGVSRDLAPIDLRKIEEAERIFNESSGGQSIAVGTDLFDLYSRNHDLRSFYSRDFTMSLGSVIPARYKRSR